MEHNTSLVRQIKQQTSKKPTLAAGHWGIWLQITEKSDSGEPGEKLAGEGTSLGSVLSQRRTN